MTASGWYPDPAAPGMLRYCGKSNSLAIGLVTFLLGWTLIGWIVALVMACTSHQRYVV